MKTYILLFFISLVSVTVHAQELNATVIINAEQTGQSNLQVFKTLERAITEFLNETKWTIRSYKQQERIECSVNIIISNFDVDNFEGSIQVQSLRPVYGSNYSTPVFNYNDKQFSFEYTEFQPLVYDANRFQNNLVSVLSFYAYTMIGFDAQTFELNSGMEFFEEAQQIVNTAQSSDSQGWSPQDGPRSRFRLTDDLLSANFREFGDLLYGYHRNGLDYMSQDLKAAKQSVAITLLATENLHRKRPNNFLNRVFYDAKTEEIAAIFTDGPQVNITSLLKVLNTVAPTKASYWRQIKF